MTSHFVFYEGKDQRLIECLRSAARFIWSDIHESSNGSLHFFSPLSDYRRAFCNSVDAFGAVSGYVRAPVHVSASADSTSGDEFHRRLLMAEISQNGHWPLPDDWTGSFAAVAYSSAREELTICCDPVGYIPLYFSAEGEGVLGGTNLIVLARSLSADIDVVGVLQRITPPFCNYGRRTPFKRLQRLLPGECIRFSSGRSQTSFDNSLCNDVIDGRIDTVSERVWDCLRREVRRSTDDATRVSVAMSGGWDSRLVLGALAHPGESIDCYTYGNASLYETEVARRCANAVGASHRCFGIEGKYFPPLDDFARLVRETEFANLLQWYPLMEAMRTEGHTEDPLLLGEICEAVDGRNMTDLASRKARSRSFVRSVVGGSDPIASATPADFENWKNEKARQVLVSVLRSIDKLSLPLLDGCSERGVAEATRADLELSFSRVRENRPAFAPMFDEVFAWFHKARFLIASQGLLLSSTFRPLSPGTSLGFMRLISSVHPRLRIRRRLMDGIARLPDFDRLANIPSAQIPWLGARSPAVLRELVWGARSVSDQLLIRRAMKRADATGRQRVLASLDYVTEYRGADAGRNVRSWFSGRWLDGEKYLETVRRRANLSAWPLISVDISAPANISVMLDSAGGPG